MALVSWTCGCLNLGTDKCKITTKGEPCGTVQYEPKPPCHRTIFDDMYEAMEQEKQEREDESND